MDYFLHQGKSEIEADVASSEQIDQATNQITIQLRFWLNSRIGQAISRPSTFRSDARLLVFALRNLSEAEDAAILALSAYSAALRRALSSPASILFIDEAHSIGVLGETGNSSSGLLGLDDPSLSLGTPANNVFNHNNNVAQILQLF